MTHGQMTVIWSPNDSLKDLQWLTFAADPNLDMALCAVNSQKAWQHLGNFGKFQGCSFYRHRPTANKDGVNQLANKDGVKELAKALKENLGSGQAVNVGFVFWGPPWQSGL